MANNLAKYALHMLVLTLLSTLLSTRIDSVQALYKSVQQMLEICIAIGPSINMEFVLLS